MNIKYIVAFWEKQMYWGKGAVIFIIIHSILYILAFETYEDAVKRGPVEFGPLLAFIELPLLFMGFFGPHMSKIQYYTIFFWGTITYAFIGALFGIILDVASYLFNIISKGREK